MSGRLLALIAIATCLTPSLAFAQPDTSGTMGRPQEQSESPRSPGGPPHINATPEGYAPSAASANPILHVPVTNLYPGTVSPAPGIKNPNAQDPEAATRGMRDFIQFNCVGCHAPNGGGGMGPSLSDRKYIYGDTPAQLFLSIYQGRPRGMPAWGQVLPESTIWDLVTYVLAIAQKPSPKLGKTISREPPSPSEQQVPTEYLQSVDPWHFTEPFSNGQKPNGK